MKGSHSCFIASFFFTNFPPKYNQNLQKRYFVSRRVVRQSIVSVLRMSLNFLGVMMSLLAARMNLLQYTWGGCTDIPCYNVLYTVLEKEKEKEKEKEGKEKEKKKEEKKRGKELNRANTYSIFAGYIHFPKSFALFVQII